MYCVAGGVWDGYEFAEGTAYDFYLYEASEGVIRRIFHRIERFEFIHLTEPFSIILGSDLE